MDIKIQNQKLNKNKYYLKLKFLKKKKKLNKIKCK
jgi:hypothetical protein